MEIQIVSPTPRDAWVGLAYPIQVEGKIIEKVRVKRCTAGEIQRYVEQMTDAVRKPAGEGFYPLVPVVDFPPELYWALDDDDRYSIEKAAEPFLPRRLRELAASLQNETGGVS